MPEWHLGIVLLAAVTLCGLLWQPLLLALPLLVLALGITLARGVVGAARAHFTEPANSRGFRLKRRALTALLHLLQPLARLRGRFLSGLVPWRSRVSTNAFAWPRTRRVSIWREAGEAAETTLERIEKRLAEAGAPVQRDDGYHEWDLAVEGGALGSARLRSCVEWHGGARQLVRFAVHPRISSVAKVIAASGALISVRALADGALAAAALLGSVAALVLMRSLWECGISAAVLTDAVHDSEAQRVDGNALAETVPLTTPHGDTVVPAHLQATA